MTTTGTDPSLPSATASALRSTSGRSHRREVDELHHGTRPRAYPVLIYFSSCMDLRDQNPTGE